jgi:two-component system, cell cycle sensor histidine kinase and response regulator CckA
MSSIPADNTLSNSTTGAVLVVEDDECLRTIVSTMLGILGRKVYAACDGEEGEREFIAHQNEIILVVVDLGLPKIEGVELVRRFRILKPTLKTVVTSGYNDKAFIEDLLNSGVDAFLKKPFNQKEFNKTVMPYLQ